MEQKELVGFEAWLNKKRKRSTGDNLMPSTIETYMRLAKYVPSIALLDENKARDVLQNHIDREKNPILLSVSRNYLEFTGYRDAAKLLSAADIITHSFLKSKKFLYSKILARNEVRVLITRDDDMRNKLTLSMLYDTAGRVAEVMSIRMRDIDFRKQKIFITGKGGKPREVFYKHTTKNILESYLDQNAKEEDDFLIVFSMPDGEPYKDQTHCVWRLCKKVGKEFLDRKLHPHMFRHTRLTHMADEGADALDIAAYAGHEDIRTSMIYVEISSYRRKRAFDKYCKDIMDED
ncbi:tyrosine-type recombinase/integrase [Candidatus Poribacteria bacterium]